MRVVEVIKVIKIMCWYIAVSQQKGNCHMSVNIDLGPVGDRHNNKFAGPTSGPRAC